MWGCWWSFYVSHQRNNWFTCCSFISYLQSIILALSFLINSKLQRFFQFLKVMILLCFQTIGLFLFCPVFLRSSRNFFYLKLSGFLTKFNILNHYQYGFRPHHILELVNNIYEGFENNQYTVRVFIDLKKAFVTVNHEILLDKLNFYGIRGIPLTSLTSYLSHRQQCVMVHDHTSSYNSVVCGGFPGFSSWTFTFSFIHQWSFLCLQPLVYHSLCWWYKYLSSS